VVDTNPYPDAQGESGSIANISKLLGVGAYTLDDSSEGSGLNYGQDVGSDTFVKSLIYSIAMGMGPGDGSISSALANLGTYLNTMPLDSLKLLQPFIPGATDNDFSDTASAANKIMAQFNVDAMLSITDFNNWVTEIFDPNGQLWKDAKDWWDTVFTQLNSYPAAGSSAATVATWWSTLFVDLGMDAPTSATLGNIIAGNYDWAKSAAANWTTFLTALGYTPTQAATAISTAQANWTSFMAAWGVGTPADVAAAVAANKQKWIDLLASFGVGTPADVGAATAASKARWDAFLASIGLGSATAAGAQLAGNNTTIGSHTTTLGTHTTNIATQLGWWQRLPENILISLDGMHVFYPLGSPSDTATTTSTAYGSARRTWYAAKADMALLQGQANSTSAPTVTFADPGSVISANTAAANTAAANAATASASNQALNDAIVSAMIGTSVTGTSNADVTSGLLNIPASNIVGQTGVTPVFGAMGAGNFFQALGNPKTVSWTHTIATGDLGVLVYISYIAPAGTGGAGWTSTVTYGGVAMTKVGSAQGAGFGVTYAYLEAWFLKAPATGTKTVTATIDSGNVYNSTSLGGNSYSCSGSKIGTVTPSIGGATAPQTVSASSATGKLLVGALSGYNTGVYSAFNHTQRYNQTGSGTYGTTWGLVFGDAPGAASVTFSAAHSGALSVALGLIVEITN
jgi:hypothetical protein